MAKKSDEIGFDLAFLPLGIWAALTVGFLGTTICILMVDAFTRNAWWRVAGFLALLCTCVSGAMVVRTWKSLRD